MLFFRVITMHTRTRKNHWRKNCGDGKHAPTLTRDNTRNDDRETPRDSQVQLSCLFRMSHDELFSWFDLITH